MTYREEKKEELLAFLTKMQLIPKEDIEKIRQLMNPVIVEYARLICTPAYLPSLDRVTSKDLLKLWEMAEQNVWNRTILPILEDK